MLQLSINSPTLIFPWQSSSSPTMSGWRPAATSLLAPAIAAACKQLVHQTRGPSRLRNVPKHSGGHASILFCITHQSAAGTGTEAPICPQPAWHLMQNGVWICGGTTRSLSYVVHLCCALGYLEPCWWLCLSLCCCCRCCPTHGAEWTMWLLGSSTRWEEHCASGHSSQFGYCSLVGCLKLCGSDLACRLHTVTPCSRICGNISRIGLVKWLLASQIYRKATLMFGLLACWCSPARWRKFFSVLHKLLINLWLCLKQVFQVSWSWRYFKKHLLGLLKTMQIIWGAREGKKVLFYTVSLFYWVFYGIKYNHWMQWWLLGWGEAEQLTAVGWMKKPPQFHVTSILLHNGGGGGRTD